MADFLAWLGASVQVGWKAVEHYGRTDYEQHVLIGAAVVAAIAVIAVIVKLASIMQGPYSYPPSPPSPYDTKNK